MKPRVATGKYQPQGDKLSRVFDLDPEWPAFSEERMRGLRSDLYHRLVIAHQRAEETDDAIKAAQEFIDEFPDIREAYQIMARLYEEKHDLEAACNWYRKGTDRIPDTGRIQRPV